MQRAKSPSYTVVALCAAAVLAVLHSPPDASAQTLTNPDSALQEILSNLQGTPLTLEQAVQYALSNATQVRGAEAEMNAAEGARWRERGVFDPELFLTLNHINTELPTSSPFAGAAVLNTKETLYQGGLRWSLPIGTQLEVAMNADQLTTNSAFTSLNPQYTTFGSLVLRQPLLGGFAASGRKELSKAEEEYEAGKARYDQQVIAVGSAVERAYWDLYAAQRDYAVQKLTCDRAGAFLAETQVRARSGLVGPNQVANAQTFLAQQELLLFERDESLGRRSDQLASLIGVRPPSAAAQYLPVDEPPSDIATEPVDLLVKRALENNLDLQAARRDADAVRALSDAADWEALPSVDIVGSYGGSGLAGTTQPIDFPGIVTPPAPGTSMGDALGQSTRFDYPTWSVGLEVTLPIGLRSGFGESDRLEAQVRAAEQRSIAISRQLEEQVRATHRELSNGKGRLKAARDGVTAAQEQIRIGLLEFKNGRATAFELVRLGEDFAVAQLRYSDALVRTAKAAATLRELTSGTAPSTP
jgi:outer membrane protein TolC